MMTFAQPLGLALTAVVVILAMVVLIYGELKREGLLGNLTNVVLKKALTANVSALRRRVKQGLMLVALVCLGLALARPQMGYRLEEVKRKGIDILFAIDTSRSMLAQDIRPNRLERAKLAVIDFSRNFDGGRLGLVPFAGSAFLLCPLTLDTEAFYDSLETLDTNVISRPGTNIGAAIMEASEAFAKGSGDTKILVLITDGEDLEGEGIAAAKEVAKEGVKIYAVGVGTASGDLIPNLENQAGVSFVKDRSGNFVKSRLDEAMLKQIATATGGAYYPLGPKGEGLESIMRDNQHLMKELEVKESIKKVPLEQFQWFLLAGLICLLLETMLREVNQVKVVENKRWKRKHHSFGKTALFLVLLSLWNQQAWAGVREAEESMKKEKYAEAVVHYEEAAKKELEKSALRYNQGVAAYRAGQFDDAAQAFEEGKVGRDLKLQEKAYYNLGNAQFRAGETSLQKDREGTIKKWESALRSYQGALALEKENKNAKINYDLVKKRLDELKSQPPQNNEQKKSSEEQEKKDQKEPQDQKQEQKKDQKNKDSQDQQPSEDGKGNQSSSDKKKDTGSEEKKEEKKKSEEGSDPANQDKQDAKEDKSKPGEEKGSDGKLQAGQAKSDKMSKEEAKALLNAVKSGQKQLLLPVTRTKDGKNEPRTGQDW
ncbi:MAG: VWA domain-containing protein [Blastochloris sp.]|nr:VWA domain-containing protein [Blastochloris sp.]